MAKIKLENLNKVIFSAWDYEMYKKHWQPYKERTGKTIDQACKFFGVKIPSK